MQLFFRAPGLPFQEQLILQTTSFMVQSILPPLLRQGAKNRGITDSAKESQEIFP
jgi:hypothetical protein